MSQRLNEFGQPIGEQVNNWQAPNAPAKTPLLGTYCRLEPLRAAEHAAGLWQAISEAPDGRNWTYLLNEPFATFEEFQTYLQGVESGTDPLFFAIIDLKTQQAVGLASYLRITPIHGGIEVGHIHFTNKLQGTTAATEAMYLMINQAFEMGYRRFEWKCDSLNEPSRRAAKRLGFTYEGTFRQMVVYKNRNRDTAWFSMTDSDWSLLNTAFKTWLATENFDAAGLQKQSLSKLTGSALKR